MIKSNNDLQGYRLKEVADFLQLSPRTVYKYLKEGKLKGYKLPSGWRFTKKAILEFITLHEARAFKHGKQVWIGLL
jgi:excisionase family DNA binding protein